jgi:hypothetical protein
MTDTKQERNTSPRRSGQGVAADRAGRPEVRDTTYFVSPAGFDQLSGDIVVYADQACVEIITGEIVANPDTAGPPHHNRGGPFVRLTGHTRNPAS